MRFSFCGLLSFMLGAVVLAQGPTLRERVAKAHGNVSLTVNADGPTVTREQMLAETDLIVRGTVGTAIAKLSADERDVTTTYEIVNPHVSFSKGTIQAVRPGMAARAITVTRLEEQSQSEDSQQPFSMTIRWSCEPGPT